MKYNIIIIALGVFTTIILAFTSYNSKNIFSRITFCVSLVVTIGIIINSGINNVKTSKELSELKIRDNLTSLADKAVSQGNREAYLNLKQIVTKFGPNRNAAISEIAEIASHWNSMTRLKGINLPEKKLANGIIEKESDYTTKELIETLLFNSQSLFRGRSAQLLASRKENYVPEALILAIFSDKHLEVVKEATLAFGRLTNFQSPDFFQPYNVWGYWLDNSEKIKKDLIQSNNIEIIPLKKLIEKLKKDIEGNKYEYMNQQWATSVDIANKFIVEFLKEKRIFEEKKY